MARFQIIIFLSIDRSYLSLRRLLKIAIFNDSQILRSGRRIANSAKSGERLSPMYDQFFHRFQRLEKFSLRILTKVFSFHDFSVSCASLRCFRLASGRRGCVWISDGVAISVQESERVVVKVLVTRLSDFVSKRTQIQKKKERRKSYCKAHRINNKHAYTYTHASAPRIYINV